MRNGDLAALFTVVVVSAFFAFSITMLAFLGWRPRVSEWAEVSVPHQIVPIEIPKRIMWSGVEYECTLVEREQP